MGSVGYLQAFDIFTFTKKFYIFAYKSIDLKNSLFLYSPTKYLFWKSVGTNMFTVRSQIENLMSSVYSNRNCFAHEEKGHMM